MDFVRLDWLLRLDMPSLDSREVLFRCHDRADIEKPKSWRRAGRSLDAIGVGDVLSQHLIATAEPQHMAAAADMCVEIDVPALLAQEIEIPAGRFRTGQDDEHCVARNGFARSHHHQVDIGFELERIEIVEIGDPRQRETRDLVPALFARIGKSQRILCRQLPCIRKPARRPRFWWIPIRRGPSGC